MKNRTELNLVFFPESLLSRRQCFQEWSHTVSSFVLPVLPPRSQKSICGFLERMLYFWEWCPEQASFRVILQSYRGAIKSSFAAIFYVQSSVLGLTAAISIYSYLWIKKKKKGRLFLQWECEIFSFKPIPSPSSFHSQRDSTSIKMTKDTTDIHKRYVQIK